MLRVGGPCVLEHVPILSSGFKMTLMLIPILLTRSPHISLPPMLDTRHGSCGDFSIPGKVALLDTQVMLINTLPCLFLFLALIDSAPQPASS